MTVRGLGAIVQEHYEWATGDQPRVPLGWRFFDEATHGGIALGEMLLMQAYSGVGKTWWAANVVVNNPTVPTVFFQLEMQARNLAQRIAAITYSIPTWAIEAEVRQTGRSQALERLIQDYPGLAIEDSSNISLSEMSEQLDMFDQMNGEPAKLVLIDFTELIRSGPALGAGEAVEKTSRALKNFARDHDVALVVLHQTNAVEGARVRTGDNQRGRVIDNGHLPLTRRAGRYGADVSADYTISCYRPSLDPEMSEGVAKATEHRFMMQLLKNRASGVTYTSPGIEHHVDIETWRIADMRVALPQGARHQGAWA